MNQQILTAAANLRRVTRNCERLSAVHQRLLTSNKARALEAARLIQWWHVELIACQADVADAVLDFFYPTEAQLQARLDVHIAALIKDAAARSGLDVLGVEFGTEGTIGVQCPGADGSDEVSFIDEIMAEEIEQSTRGEK